MFVLIASFSPKLALRTLSAAAITKSSFVSAAIPTTATRTEVGGKTSYRKSRARVYFVVVLRQKKESEKEIQTDCVLRVAFGIDPHVPTSSLNSHPYGFDIQNISHFGNEWIIHEWGAKHTVKERAEENCRVWKCCEYYYPSYCHATMNYYFV